MKTELDKDFIPHKEALALKELGFDEPCFRFQNNISHIVEEKGWLNWNEVEQFVSLPTFSQAFRWFREKYNMPSKIEATFEHETPNQYHYFYQIVTDDFVTGDGVMLNWTYEEAELACLRKLIEITKQK